MDGMGVYTFVNSKIPKHVRRVLTQNNLSIDDISLFIFHQASKMALDALTKELALPAEKVFQNIKNIGNTVSASIPIALKDALASGKAKKGDRVVLCGFGVGLSWGTAVIQL
jgi:3-oxoacyl-[acyl-carrier-protein] synthase-3